MVSVIATVEISTKLNTADISKLKPNGTGTGGDTQPAWSSAPRSMKPMNQAIRQPVIMAMIIDARERNPLPN